MHLEYLICVILVYQTLCPFATGTAWRHRPRNGEKIHFLSSWFIPFFLNSFETVPGAISFKRWNKEEKWSAKDVLNLPLSLAWLAHQLTYVAVLFLHSDERRQRRERASQCLLEQALAWNGVHWPRAPHRRLVAARIAPCAHQKNHEGKRASLSFFVRATVWFTYSHGTGVSSCYLRLNIWVPCLEVC